MRAILRTACGCERETDEVTRYEEFMVVRCLPTTWERGIATRFAAPFVDRTFRLFRLPLVHEGPAIYREVLHEDEAPNLRKKITEQDKEIMRLRVESIELLGRIGGMELTISRMDAALKTEREAMKDAQRRIAELTQANLALYGASIKPATLVLSRDESRTLISENLARATERNRLLEARVRDLELTEHTYRQMIEKLRALIPPDKGVNTPQKGA